jgi:hypothetical protein
MSTTHQVTLLRGSLPLEGTLEQVRADGANAEVVCTLRLKFEEIHVVGSGPDYFEALVAIRRQIERDGVLVRVYGASRNVWPSGMARSMGLGLKAYKMTNGKQALKQDLVSIFESGPDVEPSTVAEQEKFKDEWFASLG